MVSSRRARKCCRASAASLRWYWRSTAQRSGSAGRKWLVHLHDELEALHERLLGVAHVAQRLLGRPALVVRALAERRVRHALDGGREVGRGVLHARHLLFQTRHENPPVGDQLVEQVRLPRVEPLGVEGVAQPQQSIVHVVPDLVEERAEEGAEGHHALLPRGAHPERDKGRLRAASG